MWIRRLPQTLARKEPFPSKADSMNGRPVGTNLAKNSSILNRLPHPNDGPQDRDPALWAGRRGQG